MPTLRCLVVDDDQLFRTVIEHFIERHEALTLVASCASAIDAVNTLQREEIDLIFLDVEMPEMTGLELIESLKSRPQIVLVTAKEDYALDAFEVDVTDYLLKPVSYSRFVKAVERALRQAQSAPPPTARAEVAPAEDPDHVFIRTDGRLVKLDLKDVLYVEAQGDYMMIHTTEKRYLVHSTMKAIGERLPSNAFQRVHRSYIVRLDQIQDIEDTTLVVGRGVIPIGATYRDGLLNRLNTL